MNIMECSDNLPPLEFYSNGKAAVVKYSPFSRKNHRTILSLTKEQYAHWINGELIQNALSHLTVDEREFLMTGITPDEWELCIGR